MYVYNVVRLIPGKGWIKVIRLSRIWATDMKVRLETVLNAKRFFIALLHAHFCF